MEYIHIPAKLRNLVLDGVGIPRKFAQYDREMYYHYSKEELQVLTTPIQVGKEFGSIEKETDKFLLALRAAQKGAMYEDLLSLSSVGRAALSSGRLAPAIDPSAIQVFEDISVSKFKQELHDMDSPKRKTFEEQVLKSMMTGFFYPQKFIEYARMIGIFRFFPHLQKLAYNDTIFMNVLDGIDLDLKPWNDFINDLHDSTFEKDSRLIDGKLFGDKDAKYFDECVKMHDFPNPYLAVLKRFATEGVIPPYIDLSQFNYLFNLGQLLNIDWENQSDNMSHDPTPRGLSLTYTKPAIPLLVDDVIHPEKIGEYALMYKKHMDRAKRYVKIGGITSFAYMALGFTSQKNDITDTVAMSSLIWSIWQYYINGKIASSYLYKYFRAQKEKDKNDSLQNSGKG